jgi:hypothetical protein
VDQRRATSPAGGREIQRSLSVDGERESRLFLGPVHRVVSGAVEDGVRLALGDQGRDRGRVQNRNLVVRDARLVAK